MPKTHSFKLVLLGEVIKFPLLGRRDDREIRDMGYCWPRTAAAVVVYDITQGPEATFEKAKQWVTTLHRQADPGIVIILVGNKLDLVVADPSLRRTSKEEAEQWAKEQGLLFLEASAKDGTNVDEIFMQIARKLPLSTQQSRDPAAAKGKGVKLANNGPASASACQC
ncbi:hypothetical protein QFC21_003604 [Naganishia friedmannii]|uniref:Uncharacterized protein n=1 Tax=Naganishia friedmannii TaxID=89922 RepID=A0ACC2VP58_9TREE|nr:hypothetical protein QFC21_003604 [Naganishia friedmannii]